MHDDDGRFADLIDGAIGDSMSFRPEWTRDGSAVVYLNGGSTPTDTQRVFSRPLDASAPPVLLARAPGLTFSGFIQRVENPLQRYGASRCAESLGAWAARRLRVD